MQIDGFREILSYPQEILSLIRQDLFANFKNPRITYAMAHHKGVIRDMVKKDPVAMIYYFKSLLNLSEPLKSSLVTTFAAKCRKRQEFNEVVESSINLSLGDARELLKAIDKGKYDHINVSGFKRVVLSINDANTSGGASPANSNKRMKMDLETDLSRRQSTSMKVPNTPPSPGAIIQFVAPKFLPMKCKHLHQSALHLGTTTRNSRRRVRRCSTCCVIGVCCSILPQRAITRSCRRSIPTIVPMCQAPPSTGSLSQEDCDGSTVSVPS